MGVPPPSARSGYPQYTVLAPILNAVLINATKIQKLIPFA